MYVYGQWMVVRCCIGKVMSFYAVACLQEHVYNIIIEIVPRTMHCHHSKIPLQPTPAHILLAKVLQIADNI